MELPINTDSDTLAVIKRLIVLNEGYGMVVEMTTARDKEIAELKKKIEELEKRE